MHAVYLCTCVYACKPSVCLRTSHECEVGTFDFALPIRSVSESHTRMVRAFALAIFIRAEPYRQGTLVRRHLTILSLFPLSSSRSVSVSLPLSLSFSPSRSLARSLARSPSYIRARKGAWSCMYENTLHYEMPKTLSTSMRVDALMHSHSQPRK